MEGYREVAPGWHRWRQEFRIAGAAVTRAIVDASHVRPGMRVLDVACGAGEPALTLAPLVGPMGCVVAVDLVREMLPSSAAAESHPHVRFAVADAEDLPFAAGTFDLVTCRGAIVHFPDPVRALSEARRVLRRGGRAVFSALGPVEDTPAAMATVAIIMRHVAAQPAPGAQSAAPGPDPYRFGVPGTLSELFAAAGFRAIREEAFDAPCPWPGDATHFWRALPSHGCRVGELLRRLTPEARRRVATDAIAALRRYERGGVLQLTSPTVLASGMR